ncbi:MAG: hypothetical protein WBF29_05410, partial [Syntrophobacteria bacterium]
MTPETLKSGACRLGFHKLHHSITPSDSRAKERLLESPPGAARSQVLPRTAGSSMGLDSLLPLGDLFYQSEDAFFRSEAEFLTWNLS